MIENGLLAKAGHGNWNALLNPISAQAGKHISQRAADILAANVNYVLTH